MTHISRLGALLRAITARAAAATLFAVALCAPAVAADNEAPAAREPHLATELVVRALTLLGVNYKFGGNSPDAGLDCSGLVRHVFSEAIGIVLPRRSEEISRSGEPIDRTELKPGDLVFFNTLRRAFSHVGIYIGNGQFVHAPSSGGAVRVENMGGSYWNARFDGARRVLGGNGDQVAASGLNDEVIKVASTMTTASAATLPAPRAMRASAPASPSKAVRGSASRHSRSTRPTPAAAAPMQVSAVAVSAPAPQAQAQSKPARKESIVSRVIRRHR